MAKIAARLGHDMCLQVIHARGIVLDGGVSVEAARHGKLSCLRLAHQFGDMWNRTVIADLAAAKGSQGLFFSYSPSHQLCYLTDPCAASKHLVKGFLHVYAFVSSCMYNVIRPGWIGVPP